MKTNNRICLLHWFNKAKPEHIPALIEALTDPVFRPSDTGVNRQSLNRWDNNGLIHSSRKEAGAWRLFSAVEFIWLKAVLDMRALCLPTEIIHQVRDSLFKPVFPSQWKRIGTVGPARFLRQGFLGTSKHHQQNIKDNGGIPLLLGLLVQSILYASPLVLRIFPGYEILPLFNGSDNRLKPIEIKRLNQCCFMSVSLTLCMADNLFSNPPLFKPEGPKGLTTTDRKIFDLIRSRKLHQLILDFEHGQPIKAKALSLFPADTPIEDIPQTQISELKIKKSDSGINRIECLNEIPLNE